MMNGTLGLFNEADRLRRELDGFLGGERGLRWEFPFSRFSFLPGRSARAYPLVNIRENAEQYTVEALAPGLDPESLSVALTGNQLTLSGEKRSPAEAVKPERRHRVERAAGSFRRTIELEGEIDRDQVRAEYHEGILRISLPKTEAARPRTIEVNAS